MTQALAKVETVSTERLGTIMVKSGYFKDTRDEAQAIVKILLGAELGFGPVASMLGCYIVEGKPSLSAQLIAASIQKSGSFDYRVRETTDKVCRIEFFGHGESLGVSVFTMEDASRAGLASKDNWKKYPTAMLFARAMSQGARMFTPSVFNGAVYTPEEITDSDTVDEVEYVPTRERDVEDRSMVSRGDDPVWQRYLELVVELEGEDVGTIERLTLPVSREDLITAGKGIKAMIAERKQEAPAF